MVTKSYGKDKPKQIRESNIASGKAVCDAVRTSLGPCGMDKMIVGEKVCVSNDGATVLSEMKISEPGGRMMVEVSKGQDVEAGDGTTSVVIVCGSLLNACKGLLEMGLNAGLISESVRIFGRECCKVMDEMSLMGEMGTAIASTALNSKVANCLSSLSVDAINKVKSDNRVDIGDIRIVSEMSGTLEDSLLFDGLIFEGSNVQAQSGKVGLIQYCLSPPKSDMEFTVNVSDYTQIDNAFRQEQSYILKRVKAIKNAGISLLLIQKSILRDATNSMALHLLKKLNITVVRDIERTDVPIICKAFGCRPIPSPDHLLPNYLGYSPSITHKNKQLYVTANAKVVSIVLRASNSIILQEAKRSLHDALSVCKCLVAHPRILPGGGAVEIQLSLALAQYARTLSGPTQICIQAFAEAMELIPYTLAENAGLPPIPTVTKLRNAHYNNKYMGIDPNKGTIADMIISNVIHPSTVFNTIITLACETVANIMKIDDVIITNS